MADDTNAAARPTSNWPQGPSRVSYLATKSPDTSQTATTAKVRHMPSDHPRQDGIPGDTGAKQDAPADNQRSDVVVGIPALAPLADERTDQRAEAPLEHKERSGTGLTASAVAAAAPSRAAAGNASWAT